MNNVKKNILSNNQTISCKNHIYRKINSKNFWKKNKNYQQKISKINNSKNKKMNKSIKLQKKLLYLYQIVIIRLLLKKLFLNNNLFASFQNKLQSFIINKKIFGINRKMQFIKTKFFVKNWKILQIKK